MSDIALEFRGTQTGPDGSTVNHLAIIWEPKMNAHTQDWSCTVGAYSLIPHSEKIVGATAAQALKLAKLFVMDLLEHYGVTIYAADREQ